MAVGAQAADVAVVVRSTTAQRYYVVRNGCLTNDALGSAIPAERFRTETAQPLDNCAASTQSFSHVEILVSGRRA